jgi:hypothetical protein
MRDQLMSGGSPSITRAKKNINWLEINKSYIVNTSISNNLIHYGFLINLNLDINIITYEKNTIILVGCIIKLLNINFFNKKQGSMELIYIVCYFFFFC